MKKLIFFCIVLMVMTMQVHAQQGVGINTDGTAPDGSALLDVKSPASGNQLGMLIPRVSLATLPALTAFPGTGPATYLQLVNTNASYTSPLNSFYNKGIGMYMNFGTPASPVWRRFLTSADSTLFWGLRGNAGTNPANDYIGTSDGQSLSIRTNGSIGVSSERILVPVNATNRVEIKNNRGLLLPVGDGTNPSITFSGLNTSTGIYGNNSSGNGVGIQINSTNNLYIHGTGVSIAGGQFVPTEKLDVTGNIYTRNKITYSEYAQTSEKTFKNEFHWDGVIAAGADSPDLFQETTSIKFVVRRDAMNEYFIRIAATNGRTFTCANNLNQVTAVATTGIANFLPVNFAPEVTGPNATQTVIVREQIAAAPTYRFTIMVANHNVSVVIERWQN